MGLTAYTTESVQKDDLVQISLHHLTQGRLERVVSFFFLNVFDGINISGSEIKLANAAVRIHVDFDDDADVTVFF